MKRRLDDLGEPRTAKRIKSGPHISHVTSGSVDWYSGSSQQITWRHEGAVSTVHVTLEKRDRSNFWKHISFLHHQMANTGSCTITVPSDLPPGGYYVRVVSCASRDVTGRSAQIQIDDEHRTRCVRYALALLGLRLPHALLKKIVVMAVSEADSEDEADSESEADPAGFSYGDESQASQDNWTLPDSESEAESESEVDSE